MFEDERGWVRVMPGGEGWKRDVLIWTRAGAGRGLHYPLTSHERRLVHVLSGMIWEYCNKKWHVLRAGECINLSFGAHGFLSPVDSLVLFRSTVKFWREPRRRNFKEIYPEIRNWVLSEKDRNA